MKKLDSKFFITCGVIILIPILFIIIMFSIRGCSGSSSYSSYEEKMITQAKVYAKNHKMLPKKGKQVIIKLKELEKDGLKSAEKSLKDTTCSGSVTIINNSNDVSDKKYYNYIPYLECSDYKTDYIKDHLLKDVTESGSGLYKVGDEYIFKGNKVNNYLSFYGVLYRIIKIDKDNKLKLIKVESQEVSSTWDSKYNIQNDSYDGINNYKDSVIRYRLMEDYDNLKIFSEESREHILNQDVCVGKRSENDLSLNVTNECDEILKNQVVMLPSITDFMQASYDENCKQLGDLSCTNYNYFADFIDYSWTVDSIKEDTTKVYYVSSQGPDIEEANNYEKFNIVIYISADEIYTEGDGSQLKPYIID